MHLPDPRLRQSYSRPEVIDSRRALLCVSWSSGGYSMLRLKINFIIHKWRITLCLPGFNVRSC